MEDRIEFKSPNVWVERSSAVDQIALQVTETGCEVQIWTADGKSYEFDLSTSLDETLKGLAGETFRFADHLVKEEPNDG